MGGKNKSQRTKNNVRPSSSGRSAELLGTKVSFVGFSAIKDSGYVPALPGSSDEIDATINPNFHIVLKKMNKKDSTTKLKALNEFASLCRESDPAAVKTVLPFWPRLYCILATDTEHRVREAAHNAHKAMVSIVGRNIAPYLKQIAGAWFTSQYDTYPPAASAAALSFQEAFSANKLTEAIVFCQEEILDYIIDNLINQTPQTLSNAKTATIEEMEAKYQRVIVSSLHGYGFYLSKLPEEQLLKAEHLNKKLIENSKFWKFSKHSASIVRVAWFSAIINICQKAPFFLPDFKKQISLAVFNGLDDTDSVVLPVVWEAALHVIDKIKDCWEYVSAEKLVFPKLWKILKEGGSGCAASIFPNLLPFLSVIPEKIITDKLVFYSRFFSNLQDGIKQRSVQLSGIESEAVAECYVECLSYTIISCIEETEFCDHLISEQLLHVIELTLKDEKLQSFRKPFYNKLIGMLVMWSKQQKSEVVFAKLVRDVLNRSVSICCNLIDQSSFDKKRMGLILLSQYDLIRAFKYQTCKLKKRLKVTFSEGKSPDVEEHKGFENFFEKTPVSFQFEANDFVKKITEKYFDCLTTIETCKSLFVGQIAKVVTIFDSTSTFAHLLMLGGSTNTWNEFYTKYISVWLNDKDISVEDVSQLVFILLKYVQDEGEKQSVLHSLSETESKKVLEWCLKNDNFKFSSVKNWLLSDKVDSIILSVVKDAISVNDTDSDNSYRIIKSCLKKTRDSCILINIETVISVLKYLKDNLKNYQNRKEVISLHSVGGLIDACLSIFKDNLDENFEEDVIDIISECFKLCLMESTSSVLDQTWQDNLVHFILNGNFVRKLTVRCSKVAAHFITDRMNLTIDELHHAVRQCTKYLVSLENSENFSDVDEFVELFLKEILIVNENQDRFECMLKFCYCVKVINGKLSLPIINETTNEIVTCDFREIFSDNYMHHLTTPSLFAVLFLLQITGFNDSLYFLHNISVNKTVYSSGDHEDSKSADLNDLNLKNVKLNNYTSYLADSVLKVAAFRVFKENFSKTKKYFECNNNINIFERCTKELIQKLNNNDCKDVERELIQRGFGSVIGGLCAEAVYILHFDFLDTDNLKSTLERIINENKLIDSQCDMLSYWIHQVFSVETGFDSTDCIYKLLCSHLPKQNLTDSSVKSIINDWSSRIFKLGNLQTFEMDLLSSDTNEIQMSADIADVLSVMIDNHSSVIDEHSGWDFTMIAAASWICNIKKVTSSNHHSYSLPILHLLSSLCHLFKSISDHIASLEDGSRLKTEWKDVFRSDIHKTLVEIWADISDNLTEETMQPALGIIFHELAVIINEIVDVNILITKSNLSFWLEVACSRLECSALEIQFAAFKLLIKLTPHLVASDSECNEGNKDVNVSFRCTEKWLKRTQTIVDTMLSGFKLGDTCIVEPFTDGYIYTRCYFFLWLFILEICDTADSQLRFMYTAWIKENHLLGYLIKSLFCLMPEDVVHGHEGNIKYLELFSDPPQFSSGFWDSKTLAHLSCWTYYKLLKRLPAEVRQWWSEIDHKEATIVERLTAAFVSPLLCANEMKAVRLKGKNIQNMTVRVHPAAREVVAIYIVEESSMELVIQLPLNHPLGPTKVESGKCMVSTNQTRQWIMQLSLFLTHQNGSIWDALSLWKTLIEKKFEGVEECYICFSILHNTTQQLPRLTCQTCKKKFHNSCLYQWFTTSNKSTCPICRNLF